MQEPADILAVFEAWYRVEMPRLFNYVSYRVQDQAAAEELTAAVCERALTRLHLFDPNRGSLDNWIFSIARNTLRNHYRDQARHPRMTSLDVMPPVRMSGPSPEQVYESAESFRRVVAHLNDLPDIEQEVIALRFGAELSHRQIAQVMGLTGIHVRVLAHRALKKLRQAVLTEETGS